MKFKWDFANFRENKEFTAYEQLVDFLNRHNIMEFKILTVNTDYIEIVFLKS